MDVVVVADLDCLLIIRGARIIYFCRTNAVPWLTSQRRILLCNMSWKIHCFNQNRRFIVGGATLVYIYVLATLRPRADVAFLKKNKNRLL